MVWGKIVLLDRLQLGMICRILHKCLFTLWNFPITFYLPLSTEKVLYVGILVYYFPGIFTQRNCNFNRAVVVSVKFFFLHMCGLDYERILDPSCLAFLYFASCGRQRKFRILPRIGLLSKKVTSPFEKLSIVRYNFVSFV